MIRFRKGVKLRPHVGIAVAKGRKLIQDVSGNFRAVPIVGSLATEAGFVVRSGRRPRRRWRRTGVLLTAFLDSGHPLATELEIRPQGPCQGGGFLNEDVLTPPRGGNSIGANSF